MRLSRGVSLPELLVVLGLLTIIAAVSMPYLLGAIQNSDFNSAVRQVAGDARLARSLAISRGGYYRIHSGRDPAVSDPTLNNSFRVEHSSSGTSWVPATAHMGTSTDVITNWQDLFTLNKGVTIVSVVDGSSTAVDGAIFNSTGASVNSSNSLRSVNITLQKPDGTTKAIQINPAGNVRMP